MSGYFCSCLSCTNTRQSRWRRRLWMQSTVDIIIVNWNSSSSLQRCLESLVNVNRSRWVLSRVVIVDNASDDGCSEVVRRFPVQLIQNRVNRGFGVACNAGARNSQATYLLFLNPDILLRPDTIDKVTRLMDEPGHTRTGICGVRLSDEHGNPALCCSRFPTVGSLLAEMTGLDRL